MSTQGKMIKGLLKAKRESVMGKLANEFDPMEPWSAKSDAPIKNSKGLSEEESLDESNNKILFSYIKSLGYDPKFMPFAKLSTYSRSDAFKRFKQGHIFDKNKQDIKTEEVVAEEVLDVSSTYKKLAVKHLRDSTAKSSTNAQKNYAKKMIQRALQASKMDNHTDALNHYRGVSEGFDICSNCEVDPCICDDTHGFVKEERMSVAVRMQRAIERQRAKSDASRARTPSSIPTKKYEPKKELAEMDSQSPKGRMKPDGTRSHSTYGSRDNYSDSDPQHTAEPTTAAKTIKQASDILNKSFNNVDKKQGVEEDLKMLPRQGNETNAERQKRLSDKLAHEYKTKTGQFAKHNDNPYPSLSQYNAHGDDEYQAKKLKKQKGVAEETIHEAGTGHLMSFIKAKGLSPLTMDGNQKKAYSRSSEYKIFKARHQAEMVKETSGMGERGDDWDDVILPAGRAAPLAKKKTVKEEADTKDTVCLDIPLLIRVLEFTREDMKTDVQLHNMVERLIDMRHEVPLTMENYATIIGKLKEEVEQIDELKKTPDNMDSDDIGVAREDADPCWKGYKMVGMKKKGSRPVPNCVPESVSEGIYGIEDSPTAATHSVKAMESKKISNAAKMVKAIQKKRVNETTYDWEKSEKGGDTDPEVKTTAKITLKGGKTMTGKPRDTVEIEPVLRTKINSPNGMKPNV